MILKFKQYNENNKDADIKKKYYVSLNDKDYNEISGKYYFGKNLTDIYTHLKHKYKIVNNITKSSVLKLEDGNVIIIDLNYELIK